jgi:ligand-binding SRPBCC domain-containing protein
MAQTIHLEHDYANDPDTVWAFAKDFTMLAPMSEGSVAFQGLPTEPVVQGQVVDFQVKPFYARSFKPYRVIMHEVNDAERRFVSLEEGAGVKSWRHTLSVTATETGARQIDEIEIDAGFMTPIIAVLAKRMYRKRGVARARLLQGYRP